MKRTGILLFIITIFTAMTYAQAPKYFYGTASWYGEEFAGKKTASGQIFDPTALTAAHKNLPFGTLVEVESLENGNKVQVIINDRGPVTGSRIIDISKKAAEQLQHIETGTFYVKVTVMKEGTGSIDTSTVVSTDVDTTPEVAATNTASVDGYEEKTVEREVDENVVDLDLSEEDLEKEFITTEPEDESKEPLNDLDKPVQVIEDKNVVDLDTDTKKETSIREKEIKINLTEDVVDQGDNALVVDETHVTPELLLTNDSVIKVEKKEIDKELDIEIETPFEDEIKKEINDNTRPVDDSEGVVKPDSTFQDEQPDYNSDAQGNSYAVQVGAFRKEANALKLYDRLLKLDYPVFTTEVFVKGKRYIRVRIGYYGSMSQAKQTQNRIQSLGLPAIIIKTKLK